MNLRIMREHNKGNGKNDTSEKCGHDLEGSRLLDFIGVDDPGVGDELLATLDVAERASFRLESD